MPGVSESEGPGPKQLLQARDLTATDPGVTGLGRQRERDYQEQKSQTSRTHPTGLFYVLRVNPSLMSICLHIHTGYVISPVYDFWPNNEKTLSLHCPTGQTKCP